MNIYSDLHLHTTYCDGESTPREMVEQALSMTYHSLGICCHSPLPYPNDWAVQNEAAFKAEMAALKASYGGRISLSVGIECDNESPLPEGYDYVIASVHHLLVRGKRYAIDESKEGFLRMLAEGFGGDSAALCSMYFQAVADNVRRLRPQVIGHFDLIAKYAEADPACAPDSSAFLAAGKAALREMLPSGALLEVNTGAMSRGLRRTPYPAWEFLSFWKKLGGEVIVTSDAHCKEALGFAFEDTLTSLAALGYQSICTLQDGRLCRVELR